MFGGYGETGALILCSWEYKPVKPLWKAVWCLTMKLSLHHPAAAAKLLQSCPTLCDHPMDCSLRGFSIHGILQARTLEWVAISFSNAWKWKVKGKSLSRVWLLATPWTAAYQAPPSMGFSGQQYWSGGAIAFSTLWSSNSTLGIYPKEIKTQVCTETYSHMLTDAFTTIVKKKKCRQPKCPSTGE